MKKPLLLVLCLIGLSLLNKLAAQNDLDIVNNTGCSFTLHAAEIDPLTCTPGITISSAVAAGAIFTLTYSGPPNVVNKFSLVDCTGVNYGNLYDYTMCGWGNLLLTTLPPSLCCPSGATATLTPANAGNNAIVVIN
jgi:hypothetical protein